MSKLTSWVCVVLALCAGRASAEKIAVGDAQSNMIIAKGIDKSPDAQGFVLTQEVELPAFETGAYYRPYTARSRARGNHTESIAFKSISELQNYKPSETRMRKGLNVCQRGQFILLKISDANYLVLLPMVSPDVYSEFYVQQEKLLLKTGNWGTEQVKGDLPLLIYSYGKSPYAATRLAWKIAIESGYVATDWRSNKPYPEMYDYLGWCSWEHYKRSISENVLKGAVKTLENCGAPVRWMMVDDGYLTEEGSRIISFTPDKKKFPHGWAAVTGLKSDDKIKWMGIWRNMLGFMEGISPEHTMSDLSDVLVPGVRKGGSSMLPAENPEAAKVFFEKMILDSKESGFDFTKVDFQTMAFDHYAGMKNAVRASQYNNAALEAACKKYQIPMLNCIAQANINSLQTKYSALTRSSPDYNQRDKKKNKCSTYQSFANHLWMGQTVWGDMDMFHSHDPKDAETMALARAISGGPVYFSDEPSKVVPEMLNPFCFKDGKLLRAAAPATLLPESFFIEPFSEGKPFRVIAPLEDRVAAVALFNFTEGGQSISASFSAADYPYAGEQLQPAEAWAQPKEGLLVYDRDQKKVIPLNGGFTAEVDNFGAKLFLLYPKTKGWTVIGRTDKYLPAAAVKIKSVSDKQITFTLKESGPVMVWSEKGVPEMNGASFKALGDNLYLADLPVTAGCQEISLKR